MQQNPKLASAPRSKGLGNKIDPNKTASISGGCDLTAKLSDELLLRILNHIHSAQAKTTTLASSSCSSTDIAPLDSYDLVCKRWLRVLGKLRTSIRVKEWRFLASGRLTCRFPNLTDVDLSGAWLQQETNGDPTQHRSILFTHQFITIRLGTNAYDPISIEKFIEEQQMDPSCLDNGLEVLADGCPGLQRLRLIDVRRPSYNSSSFRRRSDVSSTTPLKMNQDDSKQSAEFSFTPTFTKTKTRLSARRGLCYLADKCLTLQELHLSQCTDDSLYAISACQNLQILHLVGSVSGFYYCTFTDIGLTILAKGCRRLVKLELSGCEASYKGIAAIGKCCFMLEELTLSNQGFYEGWIAALCYCSCLKTLRLKSCKQIDPVPGLIEHINHCPALECLELVRCNLRDRAGFSALVLIARHVKELFFQDCWGLDDDTFKLLESCRYVRLLSLEGCALLTMAGLESLVINWKDLHTLRVVYCNNIKNSETITLSTLKELKWRPDTKSLLADSLAGTGIGQTGGKFFRRGNHS